ncbi:hypothetical protein BD414DRAFT_493250 [Trametes punicea]|nr:hypothetical protein BD414DRAFT_493250 [Trametes punicea]
MAVSTKPSTGCDAYVNGYFPGYFGTLSGLLILLRMLVDFAMSDFQTSWAREHGALQVIRREAA